MVQILINSKGLNMNPLQSLYYVSPACMVSLLIPFCECVFQKGIRLFSQLNTFTPPPCFSGG